MSAVEYEIEAPTTSIPPQNLEAEEGVLGACLIGSAGPYVAVNATGLRPSDFYRRSHGAIFEAIGRLVDKGVDPDPITVAAELQETPGPEDRDAANMLDAIGGRVRVFELARLVPASSQAPQYARIVRDQAMKRELHRSISETKRALFDGVPFDEALDTFERDVEEVRSRSVVREAVKSGLDLAARFNAKRLDPPSDEDLGVVAPYPFLSRFRPGSLYVWSGYTGDGKTVALLDAMKAAASAGVRCGYASLEMSGDELVDRLVAKFGVPYAQAQSGRIEPKYVAAAEEAEKTIATWDFDVLDDEEVDPAKLRRWALAGKYEIVFVDHLHRIEFADRFEIEKTVRSIRNMARRLEIPVVLACQLSRAGDKKNPFPRPTLSSLRETAVIEHEAALVAFIYRGRDEETFERLDEAEFIVAKNRFGKEGARFMRFDGDKQAFIPPTR